MREWGGLGAAFVVSYMHVWGWQTSAYLGYTADTEGYWGPDLGVYGGWGD